MPLEIVVVSTGYNPPSREPCLMSVASQQGVAVDHRWVDAAMQGPNPPCALENILRLTQDLPPEMPVALVDLDDWLCRPDALYIAADAHRAGAWVTYGSFRFATGEPGFAAPYQLGEDVRASAWRATHLKTFRAGLLRRIDPADLQIRGAWIRPAADLAIMFPMMEMAGPDRAWFIPHVLYVFNEISSHEKMHGWTESARNAEIVRGKKPYARTPQL